MTTLEGAAHCDRSTRRPPISCARPNRACYDGCYAKESACQEGCGIGAHSP